MRSEVPEAGLQFVDLERAEPGVQRVNSFISPETPASPARPHARTHQSVIQTERRPNSDATSRDPRSSRPPRDVVIRCRSGRFCTMAPTRSAAGGQQFGRRDLGGEAMADHREQIGLHVLRRLRGRDGGPSHRLLDVLGATGWRSPEIPFESSTWRSQGTAWDDQMVPTIRIERMTSRLQGGFSGIQHRPTTSLTH